MKTCILCLTKYFASGDVMPATLAPYVIHGPAQSA
jgi:hypothetical protein